MGRVCQKHERFVRDGEECPYCETMHHFAGYFAGMVTPTNELRRAVLAKPPIRYSVAPALGDYRIVETVTAPASVRLGDCPECEEPWERSRSCFVGDEFEYSRIHKIGCCWAKNPARMGVVRK